jgi:hypothetical protein
MTRFSGYSVTGIAVPDPPRPLTHHRIAASGYGTSPNHLPCLGFQTPSLARVATSVGYEGRRSMGFLGQFRCKERQIAPLSEK